MLADLRYALRQLRRSPGFTITAILTLAIGIGANAVVFNVLNTLVLRPLALPDGDRLVFLQRSSSDSPNNSYLDYLDFRDWNTKLSGLAGYSFDEVGLDTGKNPTKILLYETTGNYFDLIGVQPYLGRFFHSSEEHGFDAVPYVVLSYAYWRSQFSGDPAIVGKTLQLNKHPFTVIGVAPPNFRGTEVFLTPSLWVPIVNVPLLNGGSYLKERGDHGMFVIGKLKPGVTPAEAEANLNSIAKQMEKTFPKEDQGLKITLTHPGLVGDTLGRPVRAFLAGVMLLAGLILLASCANLGSLFAARAADRMRELAVRLALGASRRRIVRQLLTEAVVVALLGGAVGVTGGVLLLHWLSSWRPFTTIPIEVPVNPDLATYGVALLLSLASGVLFGLAPARQAIQADPYQLVKGGSSGAMVWRRLTLRDLLLAVQIAVCAVLVTASLVAVRGLVRAIHGNFGFNPQGAIIAEFDLRFSGYTDDQSAPMQRRIFEGVQQIPGVFAAGYANHLPLSLTSSDRSIYRDGTADFRPSNAAADAMYYSVSPGYLRAAQTTLLAGRDFTWHDDAHSPMVAIVNETLARTLFGSTEKAIGGHFLRGDGKRLEVVGVVENGAYRFLTEAPSAAMFLPTLQDTDAVTDLVIRSNRPPSNVAAAIRSKVASFDSALPVDVRTWTEELDTALFAARVATVALGVMGALGVMLALTGTFGMASYVVSRRMRELGIRVALGARRNEVVTAALAKPFRLLALGSLAGLLLGVAANRVLSFVVYQASSRDPLVLLGAVIAMALLGLVASWIPAQRAAAIDPAKLLREE